MSDLVQRLRDRIEQLEAILGVDRSMTGRIREAFGLEPQLGQILGMLLSREFVTRDGLYTVLYECRPEAEWPEEKILDVQICKLRAALKRNGFDFKIETKWGEGWFITKADKAKVRAILDAPPDACTIALPPGDVPPLAPGAAERIKARRLAFLDGH